MRKVILFLIILLFIIFLPKLLSAFSIGPFPFKNYSSYPKNQTDCEKVKGEWRKVGIRPVEECMVPTTDSGKKCLNSQQCEGYCMTDLTPSEVLKTKGLKLSLKPGKCSLTLRFVGCKAILENGIVRGICID